MARAELTEQRVVAGAQRVIAERGWQSATLARIAVEAGVSRMTLHRHGLGREEILVLLARDYEEAFRGALLPVVTSRGTGAERLQRALKVVCEVTEEHLGFLVALDEEADLRFFHESGGKVRSRQAYINPLERLLADGIQDGSLRSVDIEETATVVVNTVDRTYRHLRRAHGWSPRRARERLIALVMDGVLPRQESPG